MMSIKKYWEGFVSLIYPRICQNCDTPLVGSEELVCLHCFLDLPKTNYQDENRNPFLEQMKGLSTINNAYAFLKFSKKGISQKLLHKLKYKNSPNIGIVLGKWFASDIKLAVEAEKIDIIIPVPLHSARLRKRGYNQAQVIAEGMGEVLGIDMKPDILIKSKFSNTQTKKGRIERWKAADGLYSLKHIKFLEGKRVLLVDDVVTTGATIASGVDLLCNGGAKSVSIACLATGK